jgi:hypothetical protein
MRLRPPPSNRACMHAFQTAFRPSHASARPPARRLQDLPPGVKEMNDNMRLPPAGSQSEDEIRAVVLEAQHPANMNPAGAHGGEGCGGRGAR